MTVVANAVPLRTGGTSAVPEVRGRITSRAPFKHAAIVAATKVVSRLRVGNESLVRFSPEKNCALHHLLVNLIMKQFESPATNELVIVFPGDPGSLLEKAVREHELEDKLVWPPFGGIKISRRIDVLQRGGISRREGTATVEVYGKSLRPEDVVDHYQIQFSC